VYSPGPWGCGAKLRTPLIEWRALEYYLKYYPLFEKPRQMIRLSEEEYINIPFAFLAFFVVVVDGDGCIYVYNSSTVLCISIHSRYVALLKYIQSV
jgi:hypothetical protein